MHSQTILEHSFIIIAVKDTRMKETSAPPLENQFEVDDIESHPPSPKRLKVQRDDAKEPSEIGEHKFDIIH